MQLAQHPDSALLERKIVKLSADEIAELETAADICEHASKLAGEDPFDGPFADAKFHLRALLSQIKQ